MKFTTTKRTGAVKTFSGAVLEGYPSDGGLFVPAGSVDLRAAVYSPEMSFAETVLTAIMTLLAEEFDPVEAEKLVKKIFPVKPKFVKTDNILVFDMSTGKSGSIYDYGAALLSAVVDLRKGTLSERHVPFLAVYPDRDSPDSRAIKALLAIRESLPGDIILLRSIDPPTPEHVRELTETSRDGIISDLPGGSLHEISRKVHVINLPSKAEGLASLVRQTASAYPGSFIPVSENNPAFFMASLILETALFSEERAGFSGELYTAHASSDPSTLAVGIWAWGLGLPITGFVLGASPGTALNYSLDPVVADFNVIKPGIISSLAFYEEVAEQESEPDDDQEIRNPPELGEIAEKVATAAARQAMRLGEISSSPDMTRIIVQRSFDSEKTGGFDTADFSDSIDSCTASPDGIMHLLSIIQR
ncbi:MAG: hypothetical protein Q8O19_07155 [Rectinemataceae bacterium]|nr:hypothetical protein [Rectinemataceae bacterium]